MTVAAYEFTTVVVSSVPGNTGVKPSYAVPKNRNVFVDALAPIKRFELYIVLSGFPYCCVITGNPFTNILLSTLITPFTDDTNPEEPRPLTVDAIRDELT